MTTRNKDSKIKNKKKNKKSFSNHSTELIWYSRKTDFSPGMVILRTTPDISSAIWVGRTGIRTDSEAVNHKIDQGGSP